MSKRKWLVMLLVFTLVLSMTTVAFADNDDDDDDEREKGKDLPPGQAKKYNLFSDEGDAPWALKHVAAMKAKGILKGYDDGSFKPNSSINQTEAIVMVIRMKGTETEQAAVALANKPVPVNGAQAVWWAAGHINYALENGWVTTADFQPTASAKRVWVAKLMVRALIENWEAEIAKAEYQTVTFRDAKDFRAEDVPYAAIAFAKGWMMGYPDRKFMPNKPVTRAEMAALLDRGEGIIPGSNPFEAKGTVTAIDATARRLTLAQKGNLPRDVVVSVDAMVFVEDAGEPGTFADIHVGDEVEMVLNTSGVALVVTVEPGENTAPTTPSTASTISAINLTATPRTLTVTTTPSTGTTVTTTYTLDANCKAYYQSAEVALATLAVGDKVDVVQTNGLVTTITVTQKVGTNNPTGTQITGTITAIVTASATTTLTVRDANNVEFTYPLVVNATLTSGGVAITPSQLATGLRVTITVVNSAITTLLVVSQ